METGSPHQAPLRSRRARPARARLPVVLAPLIGCSLAALLVLAAAGSAHAQEDEPPPGGGGLDLGRALADGLRWLAEQLPAGISDHLRGMLGELLPAVWDQIAPDLPGILARGFLLVLGHVAQWWMAGLEPQLAGEAVRGSLLVQTPASWFQGNAEVTGMLRDVRTVSALLAAALVPLAFLGVYFGLTDPLTAARCSLSGLVGVFAWEHAAAWTVDFGNALCLALLGGTGGFPGWGQMADAATAATAPDAEHAAIAAGAGVLVFALAGLLTAVACIFHLAWTVVLFVLGPLAMAASVLPAFNGIAKATLIAFGLAVVVKAPGVIALRLASAILGATAAAGEGAAAVTAVVVALGIAWAYTHFLRQGARFAGGNLAASGRQAVRTAQTVAAGISPDGLRQRLAQREADRATAGGGTGSSSSSNGSNGSNGRPEMFTHAHPHSHLTGRDQPGLEGEWQQIRRPERVSAPTKSDSNNGKE